MIEGYDVGFAKRNAACDLTGSDLFTLVISFVRFVDTHTRAKNTNRFADIA